MKAVKSKAEKISKEQYERDGKSLLYLGSDGYVYAKPFRSKIKAKKIGSEKIEREPGYLYFISKEGYVSRTPMARKGARK